MKLRTEVHFNDPKQKFSYCSEFLMMGSCFSNEIGHRMKRLKFQTEVSPLGICVNPVSLFGQLSNVHTISNDKYCQHNGIWFHHDFHSSLSAPSKAELTNQIGKAQESTKDRLSSQDLIVFTLGTAFVHRLKTNGEIVNNCHKQPKDNFEKHLLTIQEIETAFDLLYHSLNQKTQIILNVSPIRHTREGIPQNQLSKSTLRVACHLLSQKYENVQYLPSYEVMVDDLRDYRFYKNDLIHPTDLAIDHIFELFTQAYLETSSLHRMSEIVQIQNDIEHRALFPKSASHRVFLEQLRIKIQQLSGEVNFEEELSEIENRLLNL